MKKKVAAFLCGAMCLTAFTGCSDTELGYLKLSKEMLDTMASCQVEGQMQVDVDFDQMWDLAEDVAEAAHSGAALFGEQELTGKKTVTLDYNMQMDLDTLEYDVTLDVTCDGQKYPLGDLYYSLTKGVYVSTESVWGMYQLADDLAAGYEDSYFFSDAFAKDLKVALDQEKYIQLLSVEDMGLTEDEMEAVLPQGGFGDLYDAVFTFYEDVFKGFSSNMVTEISGGYKIETDGRAVAQLTADMLDFLAANPDQVLNAAEAYVKEVMTQMGTSEEEMAMLQTAFADMRAQKGEFVTVMGSISAALKGLMAEDAAAVVLDQFHYAGTVKKSGNSFVSDATYQLTNGDKNVIRVATNATIKAAAAHIQFPESGMTAEELGTKVSTLMDRYNPVTGVAMAWGWESSATMATLYEIRAEETPFGLGSGAEVTDMLIRDGRAYLPLRTICDALGETVAWNKEEKTAYVVKDGKNIPMQGLLQDGKSFVSIRDFETLGYTVDYANTDGLKEAVIQK